MTIYIVIMQGNKRDTAHHILEVRSVVCHASNCE